MRKRVSEDSGTDSVSAPRSQSDEVHVRLAPVAAHTPWPSVGTGGFRSGRLLPALILGLLLAGVYEARADTQAVAKSPLASVVRDVVYGHKAGMALVYDVLRPVRPNRAAVLYLVSGFWFSPWEPPERRARDLAPLLDLGFTVVVVYHGSAPHFKVPDAVADVRRAVRHVRMAASAYDIDPDRIGAFGTSSGGHLALMLGLASDPGDPTSDDPVLRQSDRVQAVVAYYPPVDLRGHADASRLGAALDFPPDLAGDVSPISHVSADDPPTLLVHGDADRNVPVENSRRLYAALTEKKVDAELLVIAAADHGFGNPEHESRATAAMLKWFEQHLAPERVDRGDARPRASPHPAAGSFAARRHSDPS
jgi:acetyl esterase/lipase